MTGDVTVISKMCSELISPEWKPFSSLDGIYIPSLTSAHLTQLELDLVTAVEKAHLDSVIIFKSIKFYWYCSFNNRHGHKVALQKPGWRFRYLMNEPDLTVTRRHSLRRHEEETTRLQRKPVLFWVTPDTGVIIIILSLQYTDVEEERQTVLSLLKGCSVWASR